MSLLAQPTLKGAEQRAEDPQFLHQFFERSVQRWPRRVAIDVPPGLGRPQRTQTSYEELSRQADSLACFLGTLVTGECAVAIMLPRCPLLYVSQLGVLKSGAAYACIDPGSPDEHFKDILEDSAAVALLTDADGVRRASRCGFDRGRVIDVEKLIAQSQNLDLSPPKPKWLTPGNLAYIIYTSGTTGRPKGVMIEHRSIVNLVASDVEEFGLQPEDRVSQNSSSAYDSSVEEIWLAFAAGSSLVVMDEETTRAGPDLIPWLRRERITVLCPPPTLLRTTGCENPASALPDLSLVYVGGEALPKDVADRWSKGFRLENGYGPTECTVTATRTTIREGDTITIGWPIPGIQAWVLNESLSEVADGEQGELCLGGVALARGYRNRPDQTREKFPEHPRLGRIYRTGDLVHRLPDGSLFYHGRIDSQVKLRGYRIELEAIESRLVECHGCREAACRVQGEGAQQALVAFVVPDNENRPSVDDLKASLRAVLPEYMIPSRFAFVEELPRTIGGKLNRRDLPQIEVKGREGGKSAVRPSGRLEEKVEAAFREVLRLEDRVSVHDDFFNDLGGDSLSAAELISLLRDDPATASVTVRDVYESRTVAGLAKRAHPEETVSAETKTTIISRSQGLLATFVQSLWLVVGLMLGSSLTYLALFEAVPYLIRSVGFITSLLLGPFIFFLALLVYTPLSLLLAGLVKRVLIGRYQPVRAPVFGSFYIRNWMVQQTVRIVPWPLLEGTVFQTAALRMLGARIGRRVHLHRGVNILQGGWDLLEIGDDATISQDATIRLVDLDGGHIVVGSVSLGAGSTLEVRAGLGTNTVLEAGAYLTALSFLPDGSRIPAGERWDGNPARSIGLSPPRPEITAGGPGVSPLKHAVALVFARFGLALLLSLPFELPAVIVALAYGIDADSALNWLFSPSLSFGLVAAGVLIAVLPGPVMLLFEAWAVRALGRCEPSVISRWSLSYVRVWLKTQVVQSAGEWLSGTLFWPHWLRLAGMKIGRGCEISTIIDVVPEFFEIGEESFFADGIYLGGPRIHQGTVTLSMTRLGKNTFLGNHAVIPMGQDLPEDILVGVSTVADDTLIRPGTSWFGQPPFELPRREVIEMDRSLTHEPSTIRYVNRLLWEALRFSLPLVPILTLSVWYERLARAEPVVSRLEFLVVVVPLLNLGLAAFFCALVLTLKWFLLGKVRPGMHPLWSCWCSRWDFLYVAWSVYATAPLSVLEGTLLISMFLRAMGAEIGRGVVLGNGFAQVVDPDMLHFEAGATVSCQFQAHTFEDRVLKIDHVRIRQGATVGSGAVLLYGADVGVGTHVAPHSVVMKHESLLPHHSYSGSPTRPSGQAI
jgi:non-ribosomal peptide synthetase-like protein